MTDPITHYCGRPIADMSIEELRVALVDSMRYARSQAEMYHELITTLRGVLDMDAQRQQKLFRLFVERT